MTQDWADRVRTAIAIGDEASLRDLYAIAVSSEGAEQASREWLALASGYDASAHTG